LGFAIQTVCIIRIFNPKEINPLCCQMCYRIINPKNTRTGITNPSDRLELSHLMSISGRTVGWE